MRVWFTLQSIGFASKDEACAWRSWHCAGRLPGNEVPRHKLLVCRDIYGMWRVVRKRHESEVDNDPLLGNRKRVKEFKRYLDHADQKAKKIIKGRLK